MGCHPLGAQAGSAVLECRVSHRPWGPRVDTRPMVVIYRFRPFRAHSSAAVGTLTSSRRHRRAVQGHGAPLPNNPTTPCTEQPLPAPPGPPPPKAARWPRLSDLPDPGVCADGTTGRVGFVSGFFPRAGRFQASPCQRVSARVSACPPVSSAPGPESCPAARRGARVRPTQPTGGFAWQHSVSAVPHDAELRPGARTRPGSPRGPVTRRDPRLGVPVTSH